MLSRSPVYITSQRCVAAPCWDLCSFCLRVFLFCESEKDPASFLISGYQRDKQADQRLLSDVWRRQGCCGLIWVTSILQSYLPFIIPLSLSCLSPPLSIHHTLSLFIFYFLVNYQVSAACSAQLLFFLSFFLSFFLILYKLQDLLPQIFTQRLYCNFKTFRLASIFTILLLKDYLQWKSMGGRQSRLHTLYFVTWSIFY